MDSVVLLRTQGGSVIHAAFGNPSSANQEVLKVIAIVLMVLDHIALVTDAPLSHPFHWLGRTVLPLFSYILIFNYLNNTSQPLAYLAS